MISPPWIMIPWTRSRAALALREEAGVALRLAFGRPWDRAHDRRRLSWSAASAPQRATIMARSADGAFSGRGLGPSEHSPWIMGLHCFAMPFGLRPEAQRATC